MKQNSKGLKTGCRVFGGSLLGIIIK